MYCLPLLHESRLEQLHRVPEPWSVPIPEALARQIHSGSLQPVPRFWLSPLPPF